MPVAGAFSRARALPLLWTASALEASTGWQGLCAAQRSMWPPLPTLWFCFVIVLVLSFCFSNNTQTVLLRAFNASAYGGLGVARKVTV